jgi:hypothetical protein
LEQALQAKLSNLQRSRPLSRNLSGVLVISSVHNLGGTAENSFVPVRRGIFCLIDLIIRKLKPKIIKEA